MPVEIARNRWVRKSSDFAVTLSERELSGTFSRKIVIEEGTAGLLMIHGQYDRRLEPGEHNLEGGLGAVLKGKDRKDIILVTQQGAPIGVTIPDIFSRDPVPFSIECSVSINISRGMESVFISNLLGGKKAVTTDDLRGIVIWEVREAAQIWSGRHSIKQLVEDLSLRSDLTITVEAHLKNRLDQLGLSVSNVTITGFECEMWDKSQERRVKTYLQISEEQAKLEGKKQLFDVVVERDIQELAEETEEIATHEKRVGLWRRLQKSTNQAEFDKITSESELSNFIRDVDTDKILKEDEFERFKQDLIKGGEDRERRFQHLTAKARMEEEFELKKGQLTFDSELAQTEIESEIRFERLRAEADFETQLKLVDLEVEKARRNSIHETELANLEASARFERELEEAKVLALSKNEEREVTRLDAELAIAVKEKENAARRIDTQEGNRIELERLDREQELLLKKESQEQEMRLRALRDNHVLELEKLDAYGSANLQALLQVSEGGKQELIAELMKNEQMKDLSPEQILAIASSDNPDIASTIADVIRSGAGNPETDKESYERLLSEREKSATELAEQQRESMRLLQEQSSKAFETLSDMTKAFASGGRTESSKSETGEEQAKRIIVCRNCVEESAVGTKFCPNCGQGLTQN